MTGIVAGAAALAGAALGWWGAVIVASLGVLALVIQGNRAPWAVCVVAMIAAFLGAWRADGLRAPEVILFDSPGVMSAVIVTAPVHTGARQQFVVETKVAETRDNPGLTARVCVIAGAAPVVRVGDVVALRGSDQSATDLPVAVRAGLAARDCDASRFAISMRVVDSSPSPQRALSGLRTQLGAVLRGAAPGDTGVLLTGLVTGDDDGFSPARRAAFIKTGTTHLTAVSGSNLALVASMLATLGAATVGRHRVPWQAVTILGVWAYALVSGSHAPSLRAAIVATAAILAFRFGRRPDFPTLILLAAGAMVVLEPRQIESLGFRLSVAASLALAVVCSGLLASGRTSRLAVVLTATIAAQIATLPLLLPIFGTVSLTSVPANIIAAPLVAIAMPLAALASVAGLVWAPLGEAIAAPAALTATALIGVIDYLGASDGYVSVGVPPFSAAAMVAVTAAALILIVGGREARNLIRVTMSGMTRAAEPNDMTLVASHRVEQIERDAVLRARIQTGNAALLASPSPRIVTREDPFDAFGANFDNPEEQPTGKEIGHEVADVGKGAEAVPREIVRHLPGARPAGEPENDHQEQQDEDEYLPALAHHGDILAAKIVEP